MMRFLLPVDGSAHAERAVRYLIRLLQVHPAAEVHLVNVRPPAEGWEVHSFLKDEEIAQARQRAAEEDLRAARLVLDAASVPYQVHVREGQIAPTIADLARELACDAILMGTHGRTALAGLVLGSVAMKVVHLTDLPVTLVR